MKKLLLTVISLMMIVTSMLSTAPYLAMADDDVVESDGEVVLEEENAL